MYPKMKLSCPISIVVLLVTGLNISLVASQPNGTTTIAPAGNSSTTTTNTSATSTSTPTAAANATAVNTSTTTTATNTSTTMATVQTTMRTTYVCIEHTCNVSGCLANPNITSTCNGSFCRMVQRFTVNQSSYNITAGCASSCTATDGVDGDFTVRTRCCQTDRCNNNDTQIVALPKNGGSTSYQAPVWILSIMMFISAF
ncbi:hypothetical protein ACJMK2_035684 [Sinanodonta woodiana]|uniref:Uncharacterized protein n=1 Tax=Sinanodonta woodiana TaxID=1069815 RepID=A0ABD3WZQ4_SINWO